MVIKTSIKAYLAIFLIGVIITIVGISIYATTQPDTSQAPITIYKGLTETEEKIVKENIKANIQQQKRKDTKSVDKKQPSYVDNESKEDYKPDYRPEPIPEAPVPIVTKADAQDTETSKERFKKDKTQANIDNLDELLKQFDPKDLDGVNVKSKEIFSKDDLKKVMADLKASGNLTGKSVIQIKKSFNAGDGKWIEVEIDDK